MKNQNKQDKRNTPIRKRRKMSEAHKLAISRGRKGVKLTQEQRAHLSKIRKGKTRSKDAIEKQRQSMIKTMEKKYGPKKEREMKKKIEREEFLNSPEHQEWLQKRKKEQHINILNKNKNKKMQDWTIEYLEECLEKSQNDLVKMIIESYIHGYIKDDLIIVLYEYIQNVVNQKYYNTTSYFRDILLDKSITKVIEAIKYWYYDPSYDTIKGWVVRVVSNVAKDMFKQKEKYIAVEYIEDWIK